MNLCTNAYHAMEESGGRLDISLKEVLSDHDPYLKEKGIQGKTFVRISVCDTGPGISPEIKNNIFDPFFTTKDIGKGTGMGLSIIHGITKSYGGFITFDSEPAKGAAFHVFLPVLQKASPLESKSSDQVHAGNERILFVDDEEMITDINKKILEKLGYQVTTANSGFEALTLFQNHPGQFDLVITDQTMPGMTGASLAEKIIRITPDMPIILCTGYSSTISAEKASSIGIKEFAFKPLSKSNLAGLIRKILNPPVAPL